MQTRVVWILTAALPLVCVGCGGGSGAAPVEATVSGTVTVNGKLATNGEVTFDASSQRLPNETAHAAPIGADGTYKIKATVGPNIVRVAGSLVDQYRGLGYDSLDFEVKPGDNTFDIALEWSPPNPSESLESGSSDGR